MNPKDRLLEALNGTKLDRVPCICPGGMMNMIVAELMERTGIMWPEAHTDADKMASLAEAVYEYGMFENYGVPFCMTTEVEGMGADVDLGSAKYEPHVKSYIIGSVSDYSKLRRLDVAEGRARVCTEAISKLKSKNEGVPVIGNLTGPISVASSLMEPVMFYKELRKKKEDAHSFMDFVTDRITAFGKAQIRAGADVIAISDPSGTGEILGPRYFDEFAVKYINKLIAGLREENPEIPIIVHICGQMNRVYAEVDKIKADALSFDAIVSIKEAKEQMPNRIIMGNVSTYALEFSDRKKIQSITRNVLKSGADIVSPACGLGIQSPLENIQAILETIKEDCHD